MKILQINSVYGLGSTGRNCREMQQYVNSYTSDSCYTACARNGGEEQTFSFSSPLDRKLHALLSRCLGKQAHHSGLATRKLLAYMDELQPDVVILHNLHANYIHFPMLAHYLAERDVATILVLHDCWFYTGKCTYYTVARCFKWKNGCSACPQLKQDNPSWWRDCSSELWHEKKKLLSSIPRLGVIGVSDWITNEARQSLLKGAKLIRRVYNWIDSEAFHPCGNAEELREKYQFGHKKIILAVASVWSSRKGLNSFIHLSSLLEDDYKIVLLGKIDAQTALPANIHHLPPTRSIAELAELYSLADVFVSMSLEETFGKVSAEALACGTPVVCFDSTANKELVGDGCGVVVPAGDVGGVKVAIERICSQGKAHYSGPCRAFALQHFDRQARIEDYISACRDVMSPAY